MPRTHTISVYLLKSDLERDEDALRESGTGLTRHAFTAADTRGTVFVAPTSPNPPDWVSLLQPATDPPVEVVTQSARVVLILDADGHRFAITFGHGWTLLDPRAYVRRFGLRTALNAVDPARLRGAHARTFNDVALQTVRQVGRVSRIEALEVDVERDLVTALGGAIADESLGLRIDGRDAVRLTAEMAHSTLPRICSRLYELSERDGYKSDFPWIDTIEAVTDPAEVEKLEQQTAERLGQRQFDGFDLYPPEFVGDEIVEYGVWPPNGGLVVIEPDARLLQRAIPQVVDAVAARALVRRHSLIARNADGQDLQRWSFWDCLHVEVEVDGQRVVLDDGTWYRIDKAFASDVDRFANSLTPSGLVLPLALRGEKEGDYNERAGGGLQYAMLDRNTITLPGRTAIEPCDLFSGAGHFVHVKRRKGGSAPLSHLFAQATVSATLLIQERLYRDELRNRLESQHPGFGALVAEPPLPARHPVVLALMTDVARTGRIADQLPFFTKVYLRQNVRALRAMGFDVHLDEIPVDTPQVNRRPPEPRRRRFKPKAPAPTRT